MNMHTRTRLLTTLALWLTLAVTGAMAADGVRVINEIDTVWHFGYEGVNLYSRPVHRIDIAYPSKDAKGNPVELSGYVTIPTDLYSGEQPVDGILLYNHFTQLGFDGAPTRGYAQGEDYAIANPLRPNYIVVASDFYGFGITEGAGQYFCYGTANGQASIDCLLAARKLLDERGISQGRFLVNAGYSSGGYDAVATQKVRDMYYSDQITFDKTVVGGFPFDMEGAFSDFVDKKDDPNLMLFGVIMILDSYNRNAGLNLDLPSMMNEPLASHFEEWYHSGKCSTAVVKDSLKGMTLSEVFKDTLYRTSSPVAKRLKQAMRDVALENDWEPDTLQNYFVFNLLKDQTVPVASCRAFADFLVNYYYADFGSHYPLFKKHIIPEKTHLQTNLVVNSDNHTVVGGIVYFINLIATLAALPVLYYDGELNTHYADLVSEVSVMNIIKKLEAQGYDVKGIVQERLAAADGGGGGGFFGMIESLDEQLAPMNLTTFEVLQMCDDSGLTLLEILEIYNYLTTPAADSADPSRSASAKAPLHQRLLPGTPDYYLFFLEDWLRENNVKF